MSIVTFILPSHHSSTPTHPSLPLLSRSSPPSSSCSSVNSAHSSASRSSGGGGVGGVGGGSQPHSPTSSSSSSSYRYRSSLPHQPLPPGGIAAHRLSSVSSHDSGFVSQDANIYSKPPSPMPSDITSQVSSCLLCMFRKKCSHTRYLFLMCVFFSFSRCRSHPVRRHQRPQKHASQSVNAAPPPL